ncbi:polymorphic toxin-type HINT domain-containing protein [Rhodopirellula sp. JC639]|uniref:polymorphic toxin-type HINT domain-containing protein n=1 Tax=Stieleria mannarensis TaxID=2755585 RepID=UPI0016016C91|nr:polymorphic toxin-type HINT domain-containing protein [Rhodopirellula sp. JC639]
MNDSPGMGRLLQCRLSLLGSLLCTLCVCGSLPANDNVADSPSLVQRALQAELDGDADGRLELLSLALKHNPEDSTARSLAGYVKHDDQWMPASRSAFLNAIDEVISEYETLRDQYAGSLAGEIALARWCRQNELDDRERMHWRNVIAVDNTNDEARKRLKLREFRGQLVTTDQIEAYKQASSKIRRAQRAWAPKLNRLRREIEGNPDSHGSAAWKELAEINDPDAIPSMAKLVPTAEPDLQRHLIRTIASIPSQVASDALVQLSLSLEDASARQAAAEGLAGHPIHAYTPQYLNRMESPVKFVSTTNQVGDYVVSAIQMRKERPDDAINLSQSSSARFQVLDSAARNSALYRSLVAREMRRQQSRVNNTVRTITTNNARIKSANDRIFTALRTATGEQMDDVPRLWWDWWKNYNEYLVTETKPEYYFTNADYRQRVIRLPSARRCECFPAGTLVHTETGKRPIETIRRGDKVLSQDTDTGELSFQLVTQTTLRPPSATMRITVAGEEITSTVGHPFWVIGKGWTMAKDLNPGDRLQGIGESQPIEITEGGSPVEAHNLIVDNTNAYFVGNAGILVHDNILRNASRIPIPGWQAK